eukprot:4203241-Pyramimonas_sp.AAC.1
MAASALSAIARGFPLESGSRTLPVGQIHPAHDFQPGVVRNRRDDEIALQVDSEHLRAKRPRSDGPSQG